MQKTPPFWMSASQPHLILPEHAFFRELQEPHVNNECAAAAQALLLQDYFCKLGSEFHVNPCGELNRNIAHGDAQKNVTVGW